MEQFFERTFKLKEHGTTVRTEVMAGTITFLAMVYILAVNPSILAASGMEPGAVFTATAISAAFGTLFMAFYANYPIALASGMGLNTYFAYSVCVPMAQQGIQDPWTIALAAVLVEGIIFILLTLCKFREALVNDVPPWWAWRMPAWWWTTPPRSSISGRLPRPRWRCRSSALSPWP